MKVFDKKARVIAVVDIVLFLLVVLGYTIFSGRAGTKKYEKVLLPEGRAPAKILFEGPSVIELDKRAEQWLLKDGDLDLPADSGRVNAFLKILSESQSMEAVAGSRASWSSLGLDGEAARSVSLFDETGYSLAYFVIGDYSVASGKLFVAFENGDSYAMPGALASYVKGQRSSWLDLAPWTTLPRVDEVEEFFVRGQLDDGLGSYRSFDYTIQRKRQAWEANGIKLDTGKVEAVLRSFIAFRATDYAKSNVPFLTKLKTELRLGNGRSMELALGERLEGGQYLAASSHRTEAFYLPAWSVEETIQPLEYFISR